MAPHDGSQALLRLNILNRSAMKRALLGIDRRCFSGRCPILARRGPTSGRSFGRFPRHGCHCSVTGVLEPRLSTKRTGIRQGVLSHSAKFKPFSGTPLNHRISARGFRRRGSSCGPPSPDRRPAVDRASTAFRWPERVAGADDPRAAAGRVSSSRSAGAEFNSHGPEPVLLCRYCRKLVLSAADAK